MPKSTRVRHEYRIDILENDDWYPLVYKWSTSSGSDIAGYAKKSDIEKDFQHFTQNKGNVSTHNKKFRIMHREIVITTEKGEWEVDDG